MTACSVDSCDLPVTARGMCRKHYLGTWRAGSLDDAPLRDRSLHVCPPDHAHDLRNCWGEHGCRCDRCRHLRKMDRQRRRVRLTAYGRTSEFRPPRVPSAPVRDHLAALMEHAGLDRIADAAQVSRSALYDIYYGPRGAKRPARDSTQRPVRESVAARLLAVTADSVDAPLVPSTGTVRRLRALVALGYSESYLAEQMGWSVGNFSHLILDKRTRVTKATYERVAELFSALWSAPLPGRAADRSRAVAKRRRWVGPLAWDDIDDPSEQPNVRGADEDGPSIDHMAVELAMAGEPVKLRPTERREAVRRLHAERWSDQRIAAALHCTDRTVLRIRRELGLAAFDFADLIQERAA